MSVICYYRPFLPFFPSLPVDSLITSTSSLKKTLAATDVAPQKSSRPWTPRLIVPRGALFFGIPPWSRWRRFYQRFVTRQPARCDRSIDSVVKSLESVGQPWRYTPRCGLKKMRIAGAGRDTSNIELIEASRFLNQVISIAEDYLEARD